MKKRPPHTQESIEIETIPQEPEEETNQEEQGKPYTRKIPVAQDTSPAPPLQDFHTENWFGKEGELAVDVYQTEHDIIIQSAIAGIKAEELDIQIENDVVTIRGARNNPAPDEHKEYWKEECFWGAFSRQIFLPEEIDVKHVEATMKDGIFTLRLPRIEQEHTQKINIVKK